MLVARAGSKAVGHAAVRFDQRPVSASLTALVVEEAYRGRGAGTALLQAAQDAARAAGCQRLRPTVGRDEDVAIGFLTRRGYEVVGETELALVMSRIL